MVVEAGMNRIAELMENQCFNFVLTLLLEA